GSENLEAVELLKDFNKIIHREFPGIITFAEESTSWEGVTKPVHHGRLGFDYKWNMGRMNDTLDYMEENTDEREKNQEKVTFPMMYNYSENFLLPFSHDEVVHMKSPMVWKSWGNEYQQFANLRLLLTYLFTHPGKKLLFMGGEFGETAEWNENHGLNWPLMQQPQHQGIKNLVADLNRLYKNEAALHNADRQPEGFEWIETGRGIPALFAFLRRDVTDFNTLLVMLNFSEKSV